MHDAHVVRSFIYGVGIQFMFDVINVVIQVKIKIKVNYKLMENYQ